MKNLRVANLAQEPNIELQAKKQKKLTGGKGVKGRSKVPGQQLAHPVVEAPICCVNSCPRAQTELFASWFSPQHSHWCHDLTHPTMRVRNQLIFPFQDSVHSTETLYLPAPSLIDWPPPDHKSPTDLSTSMHKSGQWTGQGRTQGYCSGS